MKTLLLGLVFLSQVCMAQPSELKIKVWSEFLPLDQVEQSLPTLKKNHLDLILAITEKRLEDPNEFDCLQSIFHDAKALGVKVSLWPLVTEDQGYWLNEKSADRFGTLLYEIVTQFEAAQIPIEEVYFDLEAEPDFLNTLAAMVAKFHLVKLKKFVRARIASSHPEVFTEKLNAMVKFLRDRSIRVSGVANPFVLYDIARKSDRMQRAMHLTVPDKTFDQVSFMAYRTIYQQAMGRLNSGLVYEYGGIAHDHYQTEGALDLGLVGDSTFPSPSTGFHNIDDLEYDVNAACESGIREVHFYSLEGLISTKLLDQLTPDLFSCQTEAVRYRNQFKFKFYESFIKGMVYR